jgi:hypothetical protein
MLHFRGLVSEKNLQSPEFKQVHYRAALWNQKSSLLSKRHSGCDAR